MKVRAGSRSRSKISKKYPTAAYAVVALTMLLAAAAAVQLLPGGTENADAADFSVNISNPASVTGAVWNGSNTLTFNTDANGKVYVLTGVRGSTLNIIFSTEVITTVIMDNITMTGQIALKDTADVTLLLEGTNTVTGNIIVVSTTAATATLTIDSATVSGSSEGSLRVTPNGASSNYIAGIGGQGSSSGNSAPNKNAGTITINGGTVTATGGYFSSGIGGGCNGAGDVTINGGTVTATGGNNGAGIGGGASGTGGTITINGGTVTATGGSSNNGAAGIGGGDYRTGDTIIINGGVVNATGSTNGAGIGGGYRGAGGNITVNGGTVTATGGSNAAGIGGGRDSAGGNITVNGGTVTATGGYFGAGIGGGSDGTGGKITINNGTVNVTGGNNGAGIGGGASGAGDTVIINGGTVTAISGSSNNGAAGIGGGDYRAGGTIIINGGVVNAAGSTNGAGIGGGYSGGGGNITFNGGVVTARGGSGTYGGAGIGGGHNGSGATLTVSSNAKIEAYSRGSLPAIHAANVTAASTGYYVNAYFSSPISTTQTITLAIFAKNGPPTSIGTLSLPAAYRYFAFQAPGSISPEDHNVYIVETGGLKEILRNDNNSPDIPSGRSTGSTSLLLKSVSIVSSAIWEIYVDRNNPFVPLQTDTFTHMGSSGGIYSKVFPYISDYVPVGYKEDSAPTDPTDFIPGDPAGIVVPTDKVQVIYLVYTYLIWKDIDLANADGSLTNTGWSDYYKYSEGTLTILKDPSDIGERYRILQTGSHSVTNIVMSTDVSLPIAFAGITVTGQIELHNDADITLLLEGDTFITGNIIVQSTASITIDSANGPGSSDGSLTVVPNGTHSNGLAGIDSTDGTININGGTVTVTGGTGAAGIGGTGADIIIGRGADVKAYSDGTVPAIYATNITGTGYYVNAVLTDAISEDLLIYAAGDKSNPLISLDLPAGYRGFAFQIRGSASSSNYNIYPETAGLGIVRVHDSSSIIYSVNSPGGYDGHSGTQGALPVTLGELVEITLEAVVPNGVLPAGVTFAYTNGGASQTYTEPFYVGESDFITVTVSIPAGYEFVRWYDSLNRNIGASATAQAIDAAEYSAVRSATLTAVLAVSGNRVTVTLNSDPADALLEYMIGALDPQSYTGPFWMERSETLSLEAEAIHAVSGNDFLRWKSNSGMLWYTAKASGISMPSAPAATEEYTAVYPDAGDTIAVSLDQTGGASAAFTYTVNSVLFTYTGAPFTVLKTDAVTITASGYGTHQFMRWYDSDGYIVSNTVTIGSPDLSGYGPSVSFTAYFVDPAIAATLTISSSPALSGTFLYRLSGTASWIGYSGPAVLNKSDTMEIQAVAASGYSFRFWGDDPAETDTRIVTVNADTALTAFFLSATAAERAEITLTSVPGMGGGFSWKLRGMDHEIEYTIPFKVNKTDDLTIMSAEEAGYSFWMWDDSSVTATRHVGTHTADTEYTAFFLSENPADLTILTLGSYPASSGTLQYKLSGTVLWMGYSGPVTLNKDNTVEIRTTAASGYAFRFWGDDLAELEERTYTMSGDAAFTAFFLSDSPADKATITLTSSPAGAGTFSWRLPGMTAAAEYTTPFEINKIDDLTIISAEETGYIFEKWDDTSAISTRHVGAHTTDTEYTAFFLSDDPSHLSTLTLNSYPASSGTFQYKVVGTVSWMGYSVPVTLNKGDEVEIRTSTTPRYAFRFWGDDVAEDNQRVVAVNADITLTAFFLSNDPADRVEIALTSSPAGAGTFSWQLPGMTVAVEYAAPFEINNTDDLTITAAEGTGYIFEKWDDASAISTRHVGTHTEDAEYTAFFLSDDPTKLAVLTLSSYPASSGAFQYRVEGTVSWMGYSGPVTLNKNDTAEIRAMTASGYSFRFWGDAPAEIETRIVAVNTDMKFTAFFLSTNPADKVTITLTSSPAGAGTSSWQLQGMTAQIPYTGPFDVNKTDDLTVITTAETGYAFRIWDDSSVSMARQVGTHISDAGYTAFFLSDNPADRVEITLTSSPASSGAFSWQLQGMTAQIPYSGPFDVNKTDDLTVIAAEETGYVFQLWDDSSASMIRHVGTHTADRGYTAFFLGQDTVALVLDSYPALSGTFQYKWNGTIEWIDYSAPVPLNRDDVVDVQATAASGYSFRFWGDNLAEADTRTVTVSANTELTAFFLSDDPAERVEITMTSSPLNAGTFSWQLPGMTAQVPYTGPFDINKTDDLIIITAEETGYAFQMWDDSSVFITRHVRTHAADMEYTAFFLSENPADQAILSLGSYPASSGTFQYRLSGTVSWIGYSDPVTLNKGDTVEIRAITVSGYAFRFWGDDLEESYTKTVTMSTDTALTAFFLSTDPAEKTTISLTSTPISAGLFSWQLPGMSVTMRYTAPFEVNRTDDLTIIASPDTGYIFSKWDDASTIPTRHVGTHTDDAEYTAFFLSENPADLAVLTLDSYPVSSGTFQYKVNGTVSWMGYSGPVTLNKGDAIAVQATAISGYTFRFWGDDLEESYTKTVTMSTDTALTAFFLSTDPAEKTTISLTSSPIGAGLFSWQLPGMPVTMGYAAPFEINRTDDLTIIATPDAGYSFSKWDDASTIPTRHVGMHADDAEYTAFFLSENPADLAVLTLDSYPVSSGTFQYKVNGTVSWMGYSGPVTLNKGDTIAVQATAASGYSFRFWGDDLEETYTKAITMGTDTALTAFFLSDDPAERVEITMTSSPPGAGTFSWQLPGMDVPAEYTAAFEINKTDNLTVIAEAVPGYVLRMWDDASPATTRHVGAHTENSEYTAFFLSTDPADKVTITLTSSHGTGGILAWSLPGMKAPMEYTAPFEINVTDDLTIIAAATAGYAFWMWDDASPATVRHVGIHSEDTEYTAYFLGTDTVDLTLDSYPASSCTFQYRLKGIIPWTSYTGQIPLNRGDTVDIQVTAASGYEFRAWEDSSENVLRTCTVNMNATLIAYFLSTEAAEKVTITLTSSPADAGTFSWQLPGMTVQIPYTGPFEINKTDDLTVTAETKTGYEFRMWDDESAALQRNIGISSQDTEYTAYFLTATMPDRILVILSTNIAAGVTLYWQMPGMAAPIVYVDPFYINKVDDLSVIAFSIAGHIFQFWEDLSTYEERHIGSYAADMDTAPPMTNGVVVFMEYKAYFLSTDPAERTEITLISDPADMGTFLWELSGMTAQMPYTLPFEINKTDNLTVTAVAESGYVFIMWEDLSAAATRDIGTHTEDTAEYTAIFKQMYRITATAGPNGLVDPEGEIDVMQGESQTFIFTPDGGYRVSAVFIDGEKISGTPESYTFQNVASDHEIYVEFGSAEAKKYYITATSDDITTISPEGFVTVSSGENKTFYFSANEGFFIYGVTVDGVHLSRAEIKKGIYTFSNVHSNHSIQVVGDRDKALEMLLVIDIVKGGRVEYSVDGEPFLEYISPVTIHDCTEITLRAYADDGYRFIKWETPSVHTTPEITLNGVTGTMHLKSYFADSEGGGNLLLWTAAAIILLMIICIAVWWLVAAKRRKE